MVGDTVGVGVDRTTESTCCQLASLRDELATRLDAGRTDPQPLTSPTNVRHPSVGFHAASNSPQVRAAVVLILSPVVSLLPPALSSRTFPWTVSSELLVFLF